MSKLSVQEEIIVNNLSSRFNDLSSKIKPKKTKTTKSVVSAKERTLKVGVVDVPKTLAQRGKANVRAMELSIGFETPELNIEQLKEIKKYTGWGGFSLEDLPENRKKESYRYWINLYNQKTGQEMPYDDMATTYEYYTPYWLTQDIKDLLKPLSKFYRKNSDDKIVAFETSAGVGRFIEPFDDKKFKFHAIEPSGSAHEILRRSYPQATTYNETFERFITSPTGQELISSASLVLSNPPYGARDAVEMTKDRGYEKFDKLVPYFIARSMSLLHENGIGVFLVPSSFMDSAEYKKARTQVIKSNHLLGSIRLPSTKIVPKKKGSGTTKKPAIFEGVNLIVDLIFLQRRKGELKTTKSVDNTFIDGNYFVDNPENVIGTYGKSSFNRPELYIEGNLQKLPKIKFTAMKKYKDNAYRQFKSSGGQTMVAQGVNDTSRLSAEVRTAIRFGKLGSEFLTQLQNDKSKALLIQGEAQRSYKVFKSVYKTDANVASLIKGLINSGFSTEANQISSANSQKDKIFQKVEFALNLTESQKQNPVELAKQILIFNRITKNQDYVWAKDVYKLYKGDKGKGYKSKILSLLTKDQSYGLLSGTIDPKTKKFVPCKDKQLAIFDGDSFYSGLLWPNYDATIKTIEILKKQKEPAKIITVVEEQLKTLSAELNLVQPSFVIAQEKATPQDLWIPVDILNKWFKTVYHDNDYKARTYNTEGRNDNFAKLYLTPEDYHFVRLEKNVLALETLSSTIYNTTVGWYTKKNVFDGRFIEPKIAYLYKLDAIFKDLISWMESLSIDEYKIKIAKAYSDMQFTINEYNKEAFDNEGNEKTGISVLREKLGLSSQRLYFTARNAINPLYELLKDQAQKGEFSSGFTENKYKEFIKDFYNPYVEFIIPLTEIKSGEIFKVQTEVMGWMIGDKRLFSPKYTEHGEKWGYNTKINASEMPDDARIRLSKKWLKLWNKWLKANFDEVEILTDIYNRTFKGYKKPELDGSPINIVGINKDIPLRPYQNTAVRKLVTDNGGLLALDVGLGKTFSGIATIGLLKQQGKAKRPIIVVPKSIVWKWVKDINTLFPDWNVGVIGSTKKYSKNGRITYPTDSPTNRGLKYLKFIQGVYDVLVVPYEKLQTTPVTKSLFNKYLNKAIDIVIKATPEQKGSQKALRKKLQARVAKLVKDISLSKNIKLDEGVVWDDLKIDFLMVDEAQNFKNLYTPELTFSENVKYLGVGKGSTRSYQLDMRCEDVRSRNGAIVLLSATPAKNSPIEFWNLIQYVAPEAFTQLPTPRHFMIRYLQFDSKMLPTTSISMRIQPFVAGFKNLDEFRDMLSRHTIFETLGTIIEKYGSEYPDLKKKLKIPDVQSEVVYIDPAPDQDRELQEVIDAGAEETAEGTKYWPLIEARNIRRKIKDSEARDIDKIQGMEVLLRLNAIAIHPILNKIATSDEGEKEKEESDGEKISKEEKIQNAKLFLNDIAVEDWDSILNNKKFAKALITEKIINHLSTKDITLEKIFETYSLTEINKVIREYKKWEARDKVSEYKSIVQKLKKDNKLAYPKLVVCADTVMTDIAEGGCGHIIFVANVLAHYMIKEILVQKGVKRERIAILSGVETPKSEQRTEVAEKFNGDIPNGIQPDFDVVIANQVAYEGIDLQKRTCMIHHLDLGWESATIQQRNGRGVRQGNSYTVLKIYYYILSKSADIYRFNTIQEKRNWLVQAVESQDISTNNILADSDEGLDDILIATLRDPTAFEEKIQAMKALLAREKLIAFRVRCADRLSNISDGFKLAKYFTSKGLQEKAITQFNDSEKELEEFKSDVDVNEYPFAQLADLVKTKEIYVPDNSPIGAIYFEDMVYNITFPTNSENNSASGYFVHIKEIKQERGRKEVKLDLFYGYKDRWSSSEQYQINEESSFDDSISKELNTLLLTNDRMINQFNAYLRTFYPNNEEKENEMLMDDPEELSRMLFQNKFLNLDQNQKVKNKMIVETPTWNVTKKDITFESFVKEKKLKIKDLINILLLQNIFSTLSNLYYIDKVEELESQNFLPSKDKQENLHRIIKEKSKVYDESKKIEDLIGTQYADLSKFKELLFFFTSQPDKTNKILALKVIGTKPTVQKTLDLISELVSMDAIQTSVYTAQSLGDMNVSFGRIKLLGTRIQNNEMNWEGQIFKNAIRDISKFRILNQIRRYIDTDAIFASLEYPYSSLKLIARNKATNVFNAIILSTLFQRDKFTKGTLNIPVINKANGLLYFMTKSGYTSTRIRPFFDNVNFIKSLMKLGNLYSPREYSDNPSYLTVYHSPFKVDGKTEYDFLWFRLMEGDFGKINAKDLKVYQELSDTIAKQNNQKLYEVKVTQYHEVLRNRTQNIQRELDGYEFVKYSRSKKANLDFQGAVQATYEKEVTERTADEDDLFGDSDTKSEVLKTVSQSQIGIPFVMSPIYPSEEGFNLVMKMLKQNKFGGVITRNMASNGTLKLDEFRNGFAQNDGRSMWTTTHQFLANDIISWSTIKVMAVRYFRLSLTEDDKADFNKTFNL